MKFSLVLLTFIGFSFAAPSIESKAEVSETTGDGNVRTEVDSSLIDSIDAGEESSRAKKSSGPKTVCFEQRDLEGRSFFQCIEDTELAGTETKSAYSPAPASYGPAPPSYSPSYSPSVPSYKVRLT